MKKYEYLSELEKRLSALPADARRDALNYYEEYFDAAGPDNEDATAAELGDPAEAARKILEGEGLTPDADLAAPESARGAHQQAGQTAAFPARISTRIFSLLLPLKELVDLCGVGFPLGGKLCQPCAACGRDLIVAAVAAIEGFVMDGQAAVLLQAAQHRVQRGFRQVQHRADLLRDLIAVGARFLPPDDSQHNGIQQPRRGVDGHRVPPFRVYGV